MPQPKSILRDFRFSCSTEKIRSQWRCANTVATTFRCQFPALVTLESARVDYPNRWRILEPARYLCVASRTAGDRVQSLCNTVVIIALNQANAASALLSTVKWRVGWRS